MGSLSSRPKAPTQPQVVFVPQTPTTPAPTAVKPASTQNTDMPQDMIEAREDDLLRRQRGQSGTVRTGFRGLVANAAAANERKTLLGE